MWGALLLCELAQDKPVAQVAAEYRVDRGAVQALQNSVATFGGMVSVFCEKLHWWELRILVSEYAHRMQTG